MACPSRHVVVDEAREHLPSDTQGEVLVAAGLHLGVEPAEQRSLTAHPTRAVPVAKGRRSDVVPTRGRRRPYTHVSDCIYPLLTSKKLGLHCAIGVPLGTPFGFCWTYTPRDAWPLTPEFCSDEMPSP